MVRNLASGFFESAERFPERPALAVGNENISYQSLRQEVARIGATIQSVGDHQSGVVALLAHRSKTAYAGVLGILAAGKGYAPLNPKFPLDRTLRMLTLSGSSILIAGAESSANLPNLLSTASGSLVVILPDCDVAPAWSKELPKHRFLPAGQMSSGRNLSFSPELASAAIAYLLFTSGSTGQPKGVAIHHSNVQPYVKYVSDRYSVNEEDRLSQEFDLTFDLSVHDMFVCWERGACLFSVPEKGYLDGGRPVGWAFAGQMCRIVDEEKRTGATGESGELCLAGSQVTNGYWNDPDKTRERFVQLPGCDGTTWYRTGDLVKQDAEGCIHYLGRIDHQIKVRGYRIELQEIEAVLRRVCGTEQVVAVGWPVRNGLAEGIIAFVSRDEAVDENVVLAECRESLPEYMIPRRIYLRSEFPLNANGKTDRQALIQQLDAEEGQPPETAVLRGSAR